MDQAELQRRLPPEGSRLRAHWDALTEEWQDIPQICIKADAPIPSKGKQRRYFLGTMQDLIDRGLPIDRRDVDTGGYVPRTQYRIDHSIVHPLFERVTGVYHMFVCSLCGDIVADDGREGFENRNQHRRRHRSGVPRETAPWRRP